MMKLSLVSAVALSALLSVNAESLRGVNVQEEEVVVTLPSTGCYTNMTDIYNEIAELPVEQKKRFVVCPNTVMDIGFLVPGVGIDKGQSPMIPRSNTEYLCGEDGKSSNNCIMNGGDFGLIGVPIFFRQDHGIANITVAGFTFRGQVQYSAFVAQEGSISFQDCIFEDATHFGTVVLNYNATLDKELFFNETTEEEDGILDVTMTNCVFKNITQGPKRLGQYNGIVSIMGEDNSVKLESCLFVNNHFAHEELAPIGYGVLSRKAPIVLKNNCFINNEFRGNGPVLLDIKDSPKAQDFNLAEGNFATTSPTLDCQVGATIESDDVCEYGMMCQENRTAAYTCLSLAEECAIPWYGLHLDDESSVE